MLRSSCVDEVADRLDLYTELISDGRVDESQCSGAINSPHIYLDINSRMNIYTSIIEFQYSKMHTRI